MPVCAVVLAGGVGRRFGGPRPKQFAVLGDRTVIEHSIAAFADHPAVTRLIVVAPDEHLEYVGQLTERVVRASGRSDDEPLATSVIVGGFERSDSTRFALAALHRAGVVDAAHVLVHDAARPLISRRIIDDCLTALSTHGAVATLLPSVDTIVRVGLDQITEVLPRHELRRHQTPQGFRLGVLARAHQVAQSVEGYIATDDCSVVMDFCPEVQIAIVDGDPCNLKITDAIDLRIAAALLDAPDRESSSVDSP